jgi:hypothetical protein
MFVVNSVMNDADCLRLRRQLNSRGVLICDLPDGQEDEPGHRRWMVGTFALGTVVMTLRRAQIPILFVERVHPAAVDEEEASPLSRDEQMDLYGAERVCSTDSFKGSLMLAMAANEMAVRGKGLIQDAALPQVDDLIAALATQSSQWVAPES